MIQGDVENIGPTGGSLQDMSIDIFNTFNKIAKTTGGISESSTNIAFLLQKAAYASENYYLLYYSPKNHRITHRAGYIAN